MRTFIKISTHTLCKHHFWPHCFHIDLTWARQPKQTKCSGCQDWSIARMQSFIMVLAMLIMIAMIMPGLVHFTNAVLDYHGVGQWVVADGDDDNADAGRDGDVNTDHENHRCDEVLAFCTARNKLLFVALVAIQSVLPASSILDEKPLWWSIFYKLPLWLSKFYKLPLWWSISDEQRIWRTFIELEDEYILWILISYWTLDSWLCAVSSLKAPDQTIHFGITSQLGMFQFSLTKPDKFRWTESFWTQRTVLSLSLCIPLKEQHLQFLLEAKLTTTRRHHCTKPCFLFAVSLAATTHMLKK